MNNLFELLAQSAPNRSSSFDSGSVFILIAAGIPALIGIAYALKKFFNTATSTQGEKDIFGNKDGNPVTGVLLSMLGGFLLLFWLYGAKMRMDRTHVGSDIYFYGLFCLASVMFAQGLINLVRFLGRKK